MKKTALSLAALLVAITLLQMTAGAQSKEVGIVARRLGMSTNAWTVNNEESMKQMLRMGIDYLTTDNPILARNLLSQEGYIELK